MANTLAQPNEIAINSGVSGFVVLDQLYIYFTGTDHLSSVISKGFIGGMFQSCTTAKFALT